MCQQLSWYKEEKQSCSNIDKCLQEVVVKGNKQFNIAKEPGKYLYM